MMLSLEVPMYFIKYVQTESQQNNHACYCSVLSCHPNTVDVEARGGSPTPGKQGQPRRTPKAGLPGSAGQPPRPARTACSRGGH